MYHQRFKSLEQRFSEKYEIQTNGCWVWKTGRHRPEEHPKIYIDGGYRKASHVALFIATGSYPESGRHVCHRCDNPLCVNPDHLFVGTHRTNMEDKAKKARSHRPVGSLNGRAVLTPEKVRRIREEYASGGVSQDALAVKYGVRQMTISQAVRGLTWTSV